MKYESQFLYLKKFLPSLNPKDKKAYVDGLGDEWTKISNIINAIFLF